MDDTTGATTRRQTRSSTVASTSTQNEEQKSPSKTVRFDDNITITTINPNPPKEDTQISITRRSLRSRDKASPTLVPTPPPDHDNHTPPPPPPSPPKKRKQRKRIGRIQKVNRKQIIKDSPEDIAERFRIQRSAALAEAREDRCEALRSFQASQDPRKTELEPNLNDRDEVRYFEVDEEGSLTLIVFEREVGEVWRLREVEWSEEEGTSVRKGLGRGEEGGLQVVAGRLYRVIRV